MNENMMNDDSQMNTSPMEKKSNLLAILGVVAIVAIVAFVMIQVSSNNSVPAEKTPTVRMVPTEVTEEVTPTTENKVIAPAEEEVVEIDMEAGSFYFTPNQITVKVGQLVRINLTAKDMRHNFTLDEFGVKSEVISEGESTTIEFLADRVGEFEYYCNVLTHRALGQIGTLIVEE